MHPNRTSIVPSEFCAVRIRGNVGLVDNKEGLRWEIAQLLRCEPEQVDFFKETSAGCLHVEIVRDLAMHVRVRRADLDDAERSGPDARWERVRMELANFIAKHTRDRLRMGDMRQVTAVTPTRTTMSRRRSEGTVPKIHGSPGTTPKGSDVRPSPHASKKRSGRRRERRARG